MNTTAAVAARPRTWALLVLVLGPVATVVALLTGFGPFAATRAAAPLYVGLYVALAVWSPLPVSLPAVVLEAARDAALPQYHGLGRAVRALLLVPYMATKSPARVEFIASLVGFAVAAAVAWPSLH